MFWNSSRSRVQTYDVSPPYREFDFRIRKQSPRTRSQALFRTKKRWGAEPAAGNEATKSDVCGREFSDGNSIVETSDAIMFCRSLIIEHRIIKLHHITLASGHNFGPCDRVREHRGKAECGLYTRKLLANGVAHV